MLIGTLRNIKTDLVCDLTLNILTEYRFIFDGGGFDPFRPNRVENTADVSQRSRSLVYMPVSSRAIDGSAALSILRRRVGTSAYQVRSLWHGYIVGGVSV